MRAASLPIMLCHGISMFSYTLLFYVFSFADYMAIQPTFNITKPASAKRRRLVIRSNLSLGPLLVYLLKFLKLNFVLY